MLAQRPRGAHELRGELDEVPPSRSVHPVLEGGQLKHLLAQQGAVVGLDLPRQAPQVLSGQAEGLAEVLDDSPGRVRGDGPREDGELRPEVLVNPAYQLVAQRAREVQVDVREHAHVL